MCRDRTGRSSGAVAAGAILSYSLGSGFLTLGCAAAPCTRPAHDPGDPVNAPVQRRDLARQEKKGVASGLTLHLEPASGGSAPVYVGVVLRNTSDDILWVNYKFVVGQPKEAGRTIWFDIVNTVTGDQAEYSHCAARMSVPAAHDYILLPPGSAFSSILPITCIMFKDKGPWRIVAHYEDTRVAPVLPPEYAYWVSGSIQSNPIEIEANLK